MTDYAALAELLDPPELYDLEERAAIHEFEGNLSRPEAEQRAFDEFTPPA